MMAADRELVTFVGESLRQQIPRARIEQVLLDAGWTASQAREALKAYAALEFPVPVPKPKPYLSAHDAFIYLVLFTALYVTAINLGRLAFLFIDYALPDLVARYHILSEITSSMQWSASLLIVAFPLYLFMTFYVQRKARTEPTRHESRVRKWLTYITLYLAAIILIGDLAALIYNFLGGEMSLRVVLKVATVAVISGAVFGYYLSDIRTGERAAGD